MLEARDLYCEQDERTLFRGLSFTVDAEMVLMPAATAPEKPPCCAC